MTSMKRLFVISFSMLLAISCFGKPKSMFETLNYDKNIPELQFAVDEFRKAGQSAGMNFSTGPEMMVVNFELNKSLAREEYQITRNGNVYAMNALGKHGILGKQDNQETIDYTRESAKQLLLTYPNIKGIGVNAGEHIMNGLKGPFSIENWMGMTFGKAVKEAQAIRPEIKPTFIFR